MKTVKTMKQFLLVLFFIPIAINVQSKEKTAVRGDTIRIRFENCLLEIATFDLKKNTLEKADIQNKVSSLISELENIEMEAPGAGEQIVVSYSGYIEGEEQEFKNLELSLRDGNSKSWIISEGQFLEKDFGQIVLQMEDKDYFIRLFVNKLEDAEIVNSPDFTAKLQDADLEIPETRKKLNAWLLENESGSFNSNFIGEVSPLTLDQLELSAGVGAGLIKNELVSGFNFRVGFAFAKKGIMKNKYFAEYEVLYDFSNTTANRKFDTNGFLSLGYSRNFSLDPNKPRWYGISAGYLLDRGNDFFAKNTFKIAVHKQISNSITLQPELYINDFNKSGSPALRVQITF